MIKDFTEEYYRIWNKIISGNPMCFARFADGEVSLMQGKKVDQNSQAHKIDKWNSLENGISELGKDLKDTLYHEEPEFFYAISCNCCNPTGQKWLLEQIKQSNNYITYSNLFINSNYSLFLNGLKDIKQDIFLIANHEGLTGSYPFDCVGFYPIKDDCVSYWKNEKDTIISDVRKIASTYNNTLFFISAGPMSEVLIHHLWEYNKTNQYIDVGSAIDLFVHGKKTRPFMEEGSEYFNKKCIL